MKISPPPTHRLTIELEGEEIDYLGTLAEMYLGTGATGATAAMARAILEATEAVT
jgi:hypothetical protein